MFKGRKIGLAGYDYSQYGYYFVTACTQNREPWFGQCSDGNMNLSLWGEIVHNQWYWLSEHYGYVSLDQFVVMPDHIHGVIAIGSSDQSRPCSGQSRLAATGTKIKSLSELVGAFKTTSSKLIHQSGCKGFTWQRSFHDRVIRSEKELDRIRQYIIDNPAKWNEL